VSSGEGGVASLAPRALDPAPAAGDPARRDAGALHEPVSLALSAAGLVFTLSTPLVFVEPLLPAALGAALTALLLLALAAARRGRERLCGTIVTLATWLGATIGAAAGGGLEAPGVPAYGITILAAGVLLGPRAALVAAGLVALSIFAFAGLATAGALSRVVAQTPWSAGFVHVMNFSASAVLIFAALVRLRAARERAERGEARLERLWEQLRASVEDSVAAIAVLQRGRLVYANPRLAQLLERTPEALYALGEAREILVEGDRARADEALGRLLRDEAKGEERRYRLRAAGGREVPVRAYASRATFRGAPAVVLTLLDESVREEAERARDFLRVAMDHAGEGIVVIGADQGVVYTNEAFLKLRGEPAGSPVYASAVDLAGESTEGGEVLREALEALRAQRPYRRRYERPSAEGRAVRDLSIAPIAGEDGRPMGAVGVLRDVTREVELQEQLRQSQKLEAIGQLSAGVAHDFNNYLTAILGFAALLRERVAADAEAAAHVDEIESAAEQAANLTRQLLAFGRQQMVRPRSLDMSRLVADAEPLLRRMVRDDVRLELDLAPDAGAVEADPAQLQQMLLNLAANARDAMPRGGTLRVATERRAFAGGEGRSRPGEYVALRVSDTGEGMLPDVRERVFEPFFTTKQPGEGTGLGLATVHGIVQQAGGTIEVESAPGKGTTFSILFPRCVQAPADAGGGAGAALAPPISGTVLVVEDDAAVRSLAVRALEQTGLRVLAASRGQEALALAAERRQAVDLVVTDVVMPGIDGTEVARRLRERWPDLPVLYVSGYVPPGGARAGEGARERLLPKPFTPAELAAAVRVLLAGARDA
jgi:PAS domain S-box-containing protein